LRRNEKLLPLECRINEVESANAAGAAREMDVLIEASLDRACPKLSVSFRASVRVSPSSVGRGMRRAHTITVW